MFEKLKKYSWALGLSGVTAMSFVSALLTNRELARQLAPPSTVQGLPPPGAGAANQPRGTTTPSSPGAGEAAAPVAPVAPNAGAPTEGAPVAEVTPLTAPDSEGNVLPPSDEGAIADASTSVSLEDYCIIFTRNIFDSEKALECPGMVQPTAEGTSEPVEAPLDVRLFGTVEASPAQFSWAIMSKNEASALQETFKIGDDIYGMGTLRTVARNKVLVRRASGSDVWVELFNGDPNAGPQASAAPVPAAPGALGESIRKVGDNRYELDAKELQAAMENMDKLTSSARIVPSFEGGNPVGFKVFRIKPDSFYNKLGIRNGDVIKRINGFELNSTEKALQMYQMLRTEKSIALDITRRGQNMTMDYVIR